mmetsp:Transcript_38294/g.43885  ORF Transcript_38294/g.43885 Transcript_38294/m.43885 type:complete len:95 (+) Transcript_38294:45-329(+)|eukprot:CAMPEP_0168335280 /NCGR_PEP_ID=MMETSP0213-20121227/10812_1 /TAXON_ID=151035 /ORGANISM="Euplotes harpa, Strain FSP1.4" /LENGTH=94 /DNA_ID=CAMNT_0008340171 /DNA_START=28 /DNA_END=312 /DNA_ORIENTATION=+
MPKTRKAAKKEAEKKETEANQVATFQTNNEVAQVIDRSKIEQEHPIIVEGKHREVKKMQRKGDTFTQARNQKKQLAAKRNIMNIKQNYKFKSLQ